jgi:hypothetical protein
VDGEVRPVARSTTTTAAERRVIFDAPAVVDGAAYRRSLAHYGASVDASAATAVAD